MTTRRNSKIFAIWVFAVLVALICLLVAPKAPRDLKTEIEPALFDSQKWKENAKFDREHLVYDLQERKVLIGCSAQQVRELLGKPDSEKSDYWTYEIPPKDADFETLKVFFRNELVTRCELRYNP